MVAWQSWQVERDYRDQQQQIRERQAAWRAQNIRNYTVTYSNCNASFCCQQVTLRVENRNTHQLMSNCAPPTIMFVEDFQVYTMDELFRWLNTLFERDSSWHHLALEYHPELGYITRLRLERIEGAPALELRYENLEPGA
ncbi:MAG: hypothetical protein HC915_20640 [Anaerolineae bacterium]|nr:hypothetical protein [Anaerolineae bacterium]